MFLIQLLQLQSHIIRDCKFNLNPPLYLSFLSYLFKFNNFPSSMSRATSSILYFFRQNPRNIQNPNQLRNLSVEGNDGGEKFVQIPNQLYQDQFCSKKNEHFTEIAKQVSKITRTRPRWEHTLVDEYPSFDFSDPEFLLELLKQQNNAFLSLRFFHWLRSQQGFVPVFSYCNQLFDALVEAKACNAAKDFSNCANFNPEASSLESYVLCLCEGGLVDEAIHVFDQLKRRGICPSIATWNSGLSACLKVGRTDLVWILYEKMIESSVVVDVDTVGCLIQAFCKDDKVSEGYELLRQVMEDGFVPGNVAFNKLILGFCKSGYYARISDLLHIMIAKNRAPDIYTYQEVIHGLCKKGKQPEAYRIFNDLKDRGYAPDRVMYTTMINGLCEMGFLGYARKLWFEMIRKGLVPNEYTYNVLIHGFCENGNLEEAHKLYKEMCDRGYGHTTVSYNTIIAGFCLHGKTKEASELFEEMSQKGIVRDVITYNTLIQALCKQGEIPKSTDLLKELLAEGLQPLASSYTPLIKELCEVGNVQKAKELWNDMQTRGLKPMVCTHGYMIKGLCKCEDVAEGMEWLAMMLKSKLIPEQDIFERLIKCLSQRDRLDDALLVLDSMFRIGYVLGEAICHSLVIKLCRKNSHLVGTCLEKIMESN